MRRSFLIILAGVAAGIGAHLAYYQHHEPLDTGNLEGRLAWIRSELDLTDEQFSRIKELHQASHPRLQAMASQVASMQAEFKEFERARRTADRVDFLEFARFVQERRELSQRCADSTRELVLASAQIMTPDQRRHYLNLVATAGPGANLAN